MEDEKMRDYLEKELCFYMIGVNYLLEKDFNLFKRKMKEHGIKFSEITDLPTTSFLEEMAKLGREVGAGSV